MSKQIEPYIDRVTAAMELYDSIVDKMCLDRDTSARVVVNHMPCNNLPQISERNKTTICHTWNGS